MGEEEEAEEEGEKKEEKGKREDKYRTVSVRRSTPSFRQAERAFASLCKPPRKVRPCGGSSSSFSSASSSFSSS